MKKTILLSLFLLPIFILIVLLSKGLVGTVYATGEISSESDGQGGCCTPGAAPNSAAGCRRDSNPGGFREVCDIGNGACASGKSCRSETGCALNTDCGPGKHCEGATCKDGPPSGQCQSASSLQARFQLIVGNPSSDPWGTSKQVAVGQTVNAVLFRNGGETFAGDKVNGVVIQDTITATITGPAGFSQPIGISGISPFTPSQPGNYTLSGTCGSPNVPNDTATLTVTGNASSRPDLCQSTTIVGSGRTLSQDQPLTITSKAISPVGEFWFAFYNKENLDSGIPKPIIFNNGDPYIVKKTLSSPTDTYAQAISYDDLNKTDQNWNDKPKKIQVNGYFIDSSGNQSLPKPACVVAFTVASPTSTSSPSPSPSSSPPPAVSTVSYRVAESPTDLNNAKWEDYKTVPMLKSYEFKDKTPGVKTIFVQFLDSNNNISCGDKGQFCSAQIKLLGGKPKITSCKLSFEGDNTVLTLGGQNFGSDKGVVKSANGNTELTINEWKNKSVQAVWPNAPTGKSLNVKLTNAEGQTANGSCHASSQIALGAKVFCSQPFSHQTDNVDLTLVEAFEGGTSLAKQKVNIDADGVVQGLTQKLESGKPYKLSLKAPKGLRRTIPFTAENGTTNIHDVNDEDIILPVGDIFPLENGDGVINNFDHGVLVSEWNISEDATGRSGDFNGDGKVNSIDWACMKASIVDFASHGGDDPEPVPGGPPAASFCGGIAGIQCPAGYRCQLDGSFPDAGGTCLPVQNSSPSPSPSSSPSPTPTPTPASSAMIGYTISEDIRHRNDSQTPDTRARRDNIELNYKFQDQTPGVKTIFVRFFYSDGRRIDRQASLIFRPIPSPTPSSTPAPTTTPRPTPIVRWSCSNNCLRPVESGRYTSQKQCQQNCSGDVGR